MSELNVYQNLKAPLTALGEPTATEMSTTPTAVHNSKSYLPGSIHCGPLLRLAYAFTILPEV